MNGLLTLQRFPYLIIIFCLFEALGHDAQKLLEVDDTSVCDKQKHLLYSLAKINEIFTSGDVNAM